MTEEVKEGSAEAMIFDLYADIERLLTEGTRLYDERDKLRADNAQLRTLLKDTLNFIHPSGQWDETTKLRENILTALEPKHD